MTLESLIEPLITGGCTLLGLWLKQKWDKRKIPGLKEAADRVRRVEEILSEIQYELDSYRTQEWIVTNGEKTLTGHSIQKLSIFAEFNGPGVSSIAPTFQFIPASNLARNLIALAESKDGFFISNEFEEYDDLAALHATHGVKTIIFVKIYNMQNKWVGILSIGFDEHRIVNEGEVAFLKLKASQIGAINY